MLRIIPLLLLLSPTLRAEDKPKFILLTSKLIPANGVTLTLVGPNQETVTITDFTKPVELPSVGSYEVRLKPKGGTVVFVAKEWIIKPGDNPLRLSDTLGTVYVLDDDQPRAEKIVITAENDPGPGEKGHKPIQFAKDYKESMVVPAGFYSVWVVPSNGAKAQRIAERIRVQVGRETRVPE